MQTMAALVAEWIILVFIAGVGAIVHSIVEHQPQWSAE